ncbi:hypothetical protein AU380_19015 [Pseudomonas aeruginosa]|nr:hypothetical protein AU380_19015 [Pseudomonas aeruginosa]
MEISASQRINVNSAIVSGDAGYHTLRLLADGKVAPASVYTDTGDPFADAKRNDSGSIYINAPILLKDGHLYIAASGDVLLNNTTGSQTGDAGYMGRAIIDVGNGTVWIKTSKSASVIQQEGTALIGKQVAVEGASVLLDSPLNHAGTLGGKATNGKFLYNQTSNGDVNTGTVRIDHGDGDGTSETMEGVSSSAIAKLGEQWIWERTGDTPHHLTLDETTPFQYLVFEALEYVDHKDHKPIAGDRTDSDYWVSSLTFKNPATGDVWVVSSDPTSTSGISVSRNGEATTEMPPGFALGTDLGSVTASANGWGGDRRHGRPGQPCRVQCDQSPWSRQYLRQARRGPGQQYLERRRECQRTVAFRQQVRERCRELPGEQGHLRERRRHAQVSDGSTARHDRRCTAGIR